MMNIKITTTDYPQTLSEFYNKMRTEFSNMPQNALTLIQVMNYINAFCQSLVDKKIVTEEFAIDLKNILQKSATFNYSEKYDV
jgi:hypothetical protein